MRRWVHKCTKKVANHQSILEFSAKKSYIEPIDLALFKDHSEKSRTWRIYILRGIVCRHGQG